MSYYDLINSLQQVLFIIAIWHPIKPIRLAFWVVKLQKKKKKVELFIYILCLLSIMAGLTYLPGAKNFVVGPQLALTPPALCTL